MQVKKKIFLITALLYVLYTIFPLIADTMSIPIWLPSMFSFVVMFLMFPKAFSNKIFYWFLIYAALLLLYQLAGRPLFLGIGSVADSKKMLIEFAFILPSLSILSIITFLKDNTLSFKMMKWSVIILFVSFLFVIPMMLAYGSVRGALAEESIEDVRIAGLPSYSLMHAYTLFLPVMCYCAKLFVGKTRVFAFGGMLFLCFVIYDTFVSTSLFLMILILLFTLLYSNKNQETTWLIMLFTAFVLFILYEAGFFVALIDWIMPAFEGTAVEPKLIDIQNSMLEGHMAGGTLTTRQNHHADSINAFLNNPIFGTPCAGSHSSLLDRFGGMGIIVGIPFIMIIVSYIKQMIPFFKKKATKSFFGIGIITGLVFLYYKGNWCSDSWLFYMVLMPLGLYTAENYLGNAKNSIP